MQDEHSFPVTVKRSIELLGIFVAGAIIYLGANIITPLLLAFFIAIVLLPVYRFCRRKKLPEVLAIACCILMLLMLIAGITWFFSAQIGALVADFPQIKNNVTTHLNTLSDWINKKMHFSTAKTIENW